MIKAEKINDFEMKVTVDEVVFTCEDFLFEDQTALVDMLCQCEGAFSESQARDLAVQLQKTAEGLN